MEIILQVDYFKSCGVAPPRSSLKTGEIGNDADYLTDLVVGADRSKRYPEYAAAYSKSQVKEDMMFIVARNAKVCNGLRRTRTWGSRLSTSWQTFATWYN